MKLFKLNPIAQKRLHRFKSIKRGYYSFIALLVLTGLALIGELFINNKALVVKYNGSYYFPVLRSVPGFSKQFSGKDFGESYSFEANYRDLQITWSNNNSDNWVLMPLVPYGASEVDPIDKTVLMTKVKDLEVKLDKDLAAIDKTDAAAIAKLKDQKEKAVAKLYKQSFHPLPPDFKKKHYLGTDPIGRDIVARLVYGYRIAICFSVILLFFSYAIGVPVGCMMGYFGGWFDLVVQRMIEILSRVPFIYIMMILATIIQPGFWMLAGLMVIFGWMGVTWQMRTATYREKARDYVMAARSLGASHRRIIFVHIIPSTISLIVTFIPFAISGGIITLTSLDFLGFGLPPGTPSWGELMKIGTENMDAPWIVASVVCAMVFVLFMVNMVGEAVREAFDPKKFTKYE